MLRAVSDIHEWNCKFARESILRVGKASYYAGCMRNEKNIQSTLPLESMFISTECDEIQ